MTGEPAFGTTEVSADRARPRVGAFDVLRVWAIAGVVLLHSAATTLAGRLDEPWPLWSGSDLVNLYDAAGRFGVDCFFMVSGALLLDPAHPFHLGARLRRVAIPLVAWTGVYVAADQVLARTGRDLVIGSVARDDVHDPVRLLADVVGDPAAYHLWFAYALVGIYLVVPLLRPLTALPEPGRRRLVRYAVWLWAVATPGLWTYVALVPDGPVPSSLLLPSAPAGVLGVFVLGFALARYPPRWPRPVALVVALVGLVSIVMFARHTDPGGRHDLWSYQDTSGPVVLFALGTFCWVTAHEWTPGRLVRALSRLSYRTYLGHVLVLNAAISLGPTAALYAARPALGIPVVAVVTLVGSFAVAALVERTWGLRRIL